jgi:hypothetical protein
LLWCLQQQQHEQEEQQQKKHALFHISYFFSNFAS